MAQLQDKVALITGGGSGVGLATARLFLQEGARVAINGRTAIKLQQAATSLKGGDRLLAAPADVADAAQVQALVDRVTRHFGRIDILVNNAGMNIKARTLRELTPDAWRTMVAANLDGAFYCVHAVLPQMLERKDGVIINVSSIAGKRSNPLGGAAYNAAKHGMAALGLCLGAEEKDSGIRVSNIYPGEIDTPILEHRPTPVTEEQRRKILQAEDVAAAVLFVAALPPRVSVPELIIKPSSQVYL
jgi:NADP-dependent 3-hydroxy acid dehydrogenase YdfG